LAQTKTEKDSQAESLKKAVLNELGIIEPPAAAETSAPKTPVAIIKEKFDEKISEEQNKSKQDIERLKSQLIQKLTDSFRNIALAAPSATGATETQDEQIESLIKQINASAGMVLKDSEFNVFAESLNEIFLPSAGVTTPTELRCYKLIFGKDSMPEGLCKENETSTAWSDVETDGKLDLKKINLLKLFEFFSTRLIPNIARAHKLFVANNDLNTTASGIWIAQPNDDDQEKQFTSLLLAQSKILQTFKKHFGFLGYENELAPMLTGQPDLGNKLEALFTNVSEVNTVLGLTPNLWSTAGDGVKNSVAKKSELDAANKAKVEELKQAQEKAEQELKRAQEKANEELGQVTKRTTAELQQKEEAIAQLQTKLSSAQIEATTKGSQLTQSTTAASELQLKIKSLEAQLAEKVNAFEQAKQEAKEQIQTATQAAQKAAADQVELAKLNQAGATQAAANLKTLQDFVTPVFGNIATQIKINDMIIRGALAGIFPAGFDFDEADKLIASAGLKAIQDKVAEFNAKKTTVETAYAQAKQKLDKALQTVQTTKASITEVEGSSQNTLRNTIIKMAHPAAITAGKVARGIKPYNLDKYFEMKAMEFNFIKAAYDAEKERNAGQAGLSEAMAITQALKDAASIIADYQEAYGTKVDDIKALGLELKTFVEALKTVADSIVSGLSGDKNAEKLKTMTSLQKLLETTLQDANVTALSPAE